MIIKTALTSVIYDCQDMDKKWKPIRRWLGISAFLGLCRKNPYNWRKSITRPLTGSSNFKSRFRDYRGGNEARLEGKERREEAKGKNWRESSNLRQLAGVLDQIPFQKVGFRMSISAADAEFPDIYSYVPSWLTSIAVREFLTDFLFEHSFRDHPIVSSTKTRFYSSKKTFLLLFHLIIIVERISIGFYINRYINYHNRCNESENSYFSSHKTRCVARQFSALIIIHV